MIPIEIEPTRKELEKEFMKMPEIESVEIHQDRPNEPEVESLFDVPESTLVDFEPEEELENHKWLNDINTFQAHKNELFLRGTDEDGKDFQICFDSYNFLEWIDTENLEYIKKQLTKYIKQK